MESIYSKYCYQCENLKQTFHAERCVTFIIIVYEQLYQKEMGVMSNHTFDLTTVAVYGQKMKIEIGIRQAKNKNNFFSP